MAKRSREISSPKVLVLGGRGFIGRHAVAELVKRGADVVVGSRDPNESATPRHVGIRMHELIQPSDWLRWADEFDVILNCVGILRQVWGSTYDRVHRQAPSAIATAIEGTDTRFIHISALGLMEGDRSRFLTSKRLGEHEIKQTTGDWIIARPSLIDGEGGYGASWLRGVSRLPVFVVPMDAKGQIAALTANDLGKALAKLCLKSADELSLAESREFDLGGETTYNFEEYIRGLRCRYAVSGSLAIPIPGILARLGSHLCDAIHFTPFSFGHWELLRKDNKPNQNRLPELLGRTPTPVIAPRPERSNPSS